MAVFPLLAEPESYRACDTDLLTDHTARAYWLNLFDFYLRLHLDAEAMGLSQDAVNRAAETLSREMELLREKPDRYGSLDIMLLTGLYRQALASEGITDEFRVVKKRENDAALAALPARIRELDELESGELLESLIRGLLAGNLFDMGVGDEARRYANASVPFAETLAALPPRPWFIDDVAAASRWWETASPRKAAIFADNAGADIVLGVLPLARALLKRGAEVIIAANEKPALNDVTFTEAQTLVERAATIDDIWAERRLRVLSSGCEAPLIDLAEVTDELAEAARDADLLVLVGMGRAVESNYEAKFTGQTWRVAMLKDPQVARTLGGKRYDAVFRAGSG